MNDITEYKEVDTPQGRRAITAPVADMSAAEIWAAFQAMAENQNIDPQKMQTMYQLQTSMIAYKRQEEFNISKFNAMLNMPVITKDGAIRDKSGQVRSRYSTFRQLYTHVKPILSAEGLTLEYDVSEPTFEMKIPMLRVAPILRHRNGHVEQGSYMPVPITVPNSTVSLTQATKGAVETGKRVLTIACLGIIEEENPQEYTPHALPVGEEAVLQALVEQGQKAAIGGLAAYEKWFKGLPSAADKGRLIDSGEHENMKRAAQEHGA